MNNKKSICEFTNPMYEDIFTDKNQHENVFENNIIQSININQNEQEKNFISKFLIGIKYFFSKTICLNYKIILGIFLFIIFGCAVSFKVFLLIGNWYVTYSN